MTAIAIDLGGTRVKLGLVNKGQAIATVKLQAMPDLTIEENLAMIDKAIVALLKENHYTFSDLQGIGISYPGIVDARNNRVLSKYVKYRNAHAFDFNQWALNTYNLPVAVENDARAALLGEWVAGAGKGYDNIVLLTLGTGVGSAVMIEGKLLRGVNHLAGNLGGHMSVNLDGQPCNCGFFGCLESEASTWVLPVKAAAHPGYQTSSLSHINPLEFKHLFEEAEKGDAVANDLLQHCLKSWGVGAVNMVHAYDPDVIIVGGGIMKRKEKILSVMQEMIDRYAWLDPGKTKVVAAEQVEYAGLLGLEYMVSQLNSGKR